MDAALDVPAAVETRGTAPLPPTGTARADRLARWSPLVVAALAFAVFTIRIGGAGAWWDEAVTRDVVTRPLSQMWQITSSIDLVHRVYYVLTHGVWLIAGRPEASAAVYTDLRLMSALAMAGTVGMVVVVGSQLGSRWLGVLAGLLMIAAPHASWYAQEARSGALVAFLVTSSTALLLRLVPPGARREPPALVTPSTPGGRGASRAREAREARAARRSWWPWAGYAALLLLTGLTNVIASLIVLVHAVVVLLWGSGRARRRWAICVAAISVPLGLFMLEASTQVGQVSWITRPSVRDLLALVSYQWPVAVLVVGAVVLSCGLWLWHRLSGATTPPPICEEALFLGLAWCTIPPGVLWLVSQVHPLFSERYVVYTMPGFALAMASLAPLWRSVPVLLLIAALALDGLPDQQFRRSEMGHGEALRPVARFLAQNAEQGDAVVFDGLRHVVVRMGYPESFTGIVDVAAQEDPTRPNALYRTETTDPGVLRARLARHDRVWLVTGTSHPSDKVAADAIKPRILRQSFTEVRHQSFPDYEVGLFVPKETDGSSAGQSR